MGFTIQDLLISSQERYHLQFVAGQKGWSNSISWPYQMEEEASLKIFEGKELVITTGESFSDKNALVGFFKTLVNRNAAGVIFVMEDQEAPVPSKIMDFCNFNDFPLLTISKSQPLSELIREIGMRIIFQTSADELITQALLNAIKNPKNVEDYRKDLMPHFDVLGDFQVTIVTTEGLKEMDTVERRKLSYGIQIYMENITHNAAFVYYDGDFLVITNDVTDEELDEIVEGFVVNARRRMRDIRFHVGIGSKVYGVEKLYESYNRAKSAVRMALREQKDYIYFDKMGLYRLFYSIQDTGVVEDLIRETVLPLMEYDREHGSNMMETLEAYLRCNGSIQEVAELTITHRNTVIYRMNNIRKILGCKLETVEERLPYILAIMGLSMD